MCHHKKWLLQETTVRYAVSEMFKFLMQNSILNFFFLGKGSFFKSKLLQSSHPGFFV